MSDKIRVQNPHKFNVGIITPEKPYGHNIVPGAFALCTQDEVDYLMATSELFQNGTLRVQGEKKKEIEEQLGVDVENNANFMGDEDIKAKLGGSVSQLKKWLDADDIQPYVLERICEIAKEMNLGLNKIRILQEKIPNFEFTK